MELNRFGCKIRNLGVYVVTRPRSSRDARSASEGDTDLHNQCKMTTMVDLWGTQTKIKVIITFTFRDTAENVVVNRSDLQRFDVIFAIGYFGYILFSNCPKSPSS